jgi:hypothetical protein
LKSSDNGASKTNDESGQSTNGEETVEIVGACKLMDGFFLGDAICAEVNL